ncbi:MAG TPA: RNA polymerase sigma factor [Vicinamibacteria bacterium]|jgi:RNA polymerase sigma-70 factor (ECF subfamily)|nr:RNA polymerase sigma factor [Vicinamibacteria bacterium]
MRPTDEQLVEAFQNGDAAAFDTLLGRWDLKIRGAIYRLVGPHEDVRDLCQETFLKAYRGLGGFKKEARFSSWLYQIAVNVCRDRQRRRRGRTLVSLDELEANEARVPSASALDLVEGRDLSRLVAAAVEALPADQREVIVLKEYQGLTFLEIADTLDLPISTVKTRLYRGLGQLRQRLERQGIRAAAPIAAPIP